MEGEALRQMDRTVQRRIVAARFPVLKTLEQFNWEVAQENQPATGPEPLPVGLSGKPRQRHLYGRSGPR